MATILDPVVILVAAWTHPPKAAMMQVVCAHFLGTSHLPAPYLTHLVPFLEVMLIDPLCLIIVSQSPNRMAAAVTARVDHRKEMLVDHSVRKVAQFL